MAPAAQSSRTGPLEWLACWTATWRTRGRHRGLAAAPCSTARELTVTDTEARAPTRYTQRHREATYQSPHHVTLTGLVPGERRFYRVGSATGGWSDARSFIAPPAAATDAAASSPSSSLYPFRLAVVGDTGSTHNTTSTLDHMVASDPAAVLHVGDFVYADLYDPVGGYDADPNTTHQPRWDAFSRMLSPLVSTTPMVTTVGKHEREADTAGSEWQSYAARYAPPGGDKGYYSTRAGPVHVVVVNTYARDVAAQRAWLKADLAAVDRKVTPWVVLAMHAAWYTTYVGECGSSGERWGGGRGGGEERNTLPRARGGPPPPTLRPPATPTIDDPNTRTHTHTHSSPHPAPFPLLPPPPPNPPPAHYREVECLRVALEPVVAAGGVDVVFAGHVHAFERTHRVLNHAPSLCGPPHICVGDGGNAERMYLTFADAPAGSSTTQGSRNGGCPAEVYKKADKCAASAPGPFCSVGQAPWSAYREPSFGFGMLQIESPTKATWTWHRNQDGVRVAADRATLTRGDALCEGVAGSPA